MSNVTIRMEGNMFIETESTEAEIRSEIDNAKTEEDTLRVKGRLFLIDSDNNEDRLVDGIILVNIYKIIVIY